MRPLDPLSEMSPPTRLGQLLREAPPDEVEAELLYLEGIELGDLERAACDHARGMLALRVGQLVQAQQSLERAAAVFESCGRTEAAGLSRCEKWLATIRRGPRKVYDEASEALAALASEHADSRLVRVVATHYRATASRLSGRAEATLEMLLAAFGESDGLLVERAQVLNSLGTLYVVLGAYGAADAVLAHAAELNHQIGDRVSEAISYGQLGSAALGRGEPEKARRFLQKQEWFASRVGDNFGRARALVLLADVAIDLGRPDDAIELAAQARQVAEAVDPPLSLWMAYATRTIGRAQLEVGAEEAAATLSEARERFSALGNQLGDAFVAWDLARLEAKDAPLADARWFEPAWAFASLGLTARVAQLLGDLRSQRGGERSALDEVIAAASQAYPHLAASQEVELVLSAPDTVAGIATRRISGQRNLGRLSAHAVAPRGLYLAAIAAEAIGTAIRPIPSRRSAAALVGQLPGVALWAWTRDVDPVIVARDLSSLRVSLGDGTRAVVGLFPEASITAPPFGGELGAELRGAELAQHVARVLRAGAATLQVIDGTPWGGEAEALARMSGFRSS